MKREKATGYMKQHSHSLARFVVLAIAVTAFVVAGHAADTSDAEPDAAPNSSDQTVMQEPTARTALREQHAAYEQAVAEAREELRALYEKYPPEQPEDGKDVPEEFLEPNPAYKKASEPIIARLRDLEQELTNSYNAYLKQHPNHWEVIDAFAGFLFDHAHMKEACTWWKKGADLNPDSADMQNDLGVCESELGRPLEAMRRFRKAIELDPDLATAHFNLATVYFTSRYKVMEQEGWTLPQTYWKSQDAYEKAFELEPDSFEYAMNSAQNYYMAHYFEVTDIWDEALESWKRCLDLDLTAKQEAYVYTNLGRIERKHGAPEQARNWLKKAQAAHRTPVAAHLLEKLATQDKPAVDSESTEAGQAAP